MAVNQSQVDHILSTASADDPEVKLQNLQDEVDLLKKSVKKLLIDLRERMNEMENPFIVSPHSLPAVEMPEKNTEELPESQEEIEKGFENEEDADKTTNEYPEIKEPVLKSKEDILSDLQERYEEIQARALPLPIETIPSERPRLQKLHQLFEWISRMVKKYGHDRLDIMTGTYHEMGYITDDAYRQINEIARLMPESIGEFHEISSEEFVSELYLLNRILIPEDSSLDREMIEVIMEKKETEVINTKKESEEDSGYEEDWIELLEKV